MKPWHQYTGASESYILKEIICPFRKATALPTITKEFGVTTGYSWIGTAYLLLAASLAPLYGKLSDLVGRKKLLQGSIGVFMVGSALCGAAQSFTMLAICRGVQGIGGGGILQLVQITISDIVPLADRGKFTGFIGATWGCASVLGPLIGVRYLFSYRTFGPDTSQP